MSAAEYSNAPTAAAREATTEAAGGTTTSHSFFNHITPFNYFLFLTLCLLIFLGYLILPKGLRAQYFGAGRRRYRRRRKGHTTRWQNKLSSRSAAAAKGNSLPPEDILENIYAYSHSFSPQEHVDKLLGENTPSSPTTSYLRSDINSSRASSAIDSVWSGIVDESKPTSEAGREEHQQQPTLPGKLRERLMQPPGVKLIAHGTKCKPRPVWITLHYDKQSTKSTTPPEYKNCLTWRAELKPSSSHKASMGPMVAEMPRLGNLRKVELGEVLGIELGKRTTALRRVQTAKGAHENSCFSLLTKTGTLDLECLSLNGAVLAEAGNRTGQPPSAEEVRAAFITCLALAMSSNGLQLNGLRQKFTSPASSSLQSQLQGLGGGSVVSPLSGQWDERSLYSGLLSDGKTISTVSL